MGTPLDWPAVIGAFVDFERGVGGLAPQTLRHRDQYMRTFARWWDTARSDGDPAEASTADLADFLVHEADRGISAITRKCYVVTLRRFYSWLVLTGRGRHDPTVQLKAPRVSATEITVYSPSDVDAILDYTSALTDFRGRMRHTIVATLRYTGLRSGELRTMRMDQLDVDAGRAQVIGKASRQRSVVIPPPLQPVLAAYLRDIRPLLPDSPLLLVNPHCLVTTPHSGFSHEAVYREVELAGQRAGVAGRHFPHRWRHTYATELVRAGIDIHIVQRLLGHRTIHATVGYTHLAVDDLADAVAKVWQPQSAMVPPPAGG